MRCEFLAVSEMNASRIKGVSYRAMLSMLTTVHACFAMHNLTTDCTPYLHPAQDGHVQLKPRSGMSPSVSFGTVQYCILL